MNRQYIINPATNHKCSINSKKGRSIVKKYNLYGGSNHKSCSNKRKAKTCNTLPNCKWEDNECQDIKRKITAKGPTRNLFNDKKKECKDLDGDTCSSRTDCQRTQTGCRTYEKSAKKWIASAAYHNKDNSKFPSDLSSDLTTSCSLLEEEDECRSRTDCRYTKQGCEPYEITSTTRHWNLPRDSLRDHHNRDNERREDLMTPNEFLPDDSDDYRRERPMPRQNKRMGHMQYSPRDTLSGDDYGKYGVDWDHYRGPGPQ